MTGIPTADGASVPPILRRADGTPTLIGMVHLGPLPGSPRFGGDLDTVIAQAREDATALVDAGFDALMVENLGDAPYRKDDVAPVTVAAMTRAVAAVAMLGVPVGVNVLRNDAQAALAVAAATGATMIRVNVLSGTMFTDQGIIEGRAAELARARAAFAPDVLVLADVFVKHAVPPPGLRIEDAARDLWERAGADAIVVSGAATGHPVDPERVRTVADAVPDASLVVGSGADPERIAALRAVVGDHLAAVIVGTAVKVDGVTTAPVDRDRAARFVAAVRS